MKLKFVVTFYSLPQLLTFPRRLMNLWLLVTALSFRPFTFLSFCYFPFFFFYAGVVEFWSAKLELQNLKGEYYMYGI